MSDYARALAEQIKARETGASMALSSDQNPDQVGRANVLSRQLNMPADFVDRNLSFAEQMAQRVKARDAIAAHPVIGEWAADPRNAAVGKDDLDSLKKNAAYWQRHLERFGTLKAPPSVRPSLGNLLSGVSANLSAMRAGILQMGSDALGNVRPSSAPGIPTLGSGSAMRLRETGQAQARVAATTPEFKSAWASGAYSGVSSLIQQAPGLVASVATGNPLPAIAYGSLSVGTQGYGKYRARGATPAMAALGGAGEGAVEGATEFLPMHYIVDAFGKAGAKSMLVELGKSVLSDIPGEQIATLAQDAIDTAIANPGKTWADYGKERPDAALQTLIATVVQGGLTAGPVLGVKLYGDRIKKQQAEADAAFLNDLATGATESKTRSRDPSAFARFLELQAQGTPVENLYIPGEKLAEYFQMDGAEPWGWDDSIETQLNDALASGGDVVVKTSDFATHVAGTPAWEALKNDVRLSPGGWSFNDAAAWSEDDATQALRDDFEKQVEADRAARAPVEKLYQSIRDKLTFAGFTQDAADTQAALLTQRYTTRADRLGKEITGAEFDTVGVNRVLPEKLGPIVAADGLDTLIETMKKDKAGGVKGASLLEFIAKNGGIEDTGGDLKAMGADQWHKGKFRKKLIRDGKQKEALPGMGGGIGNASGFGQDEIALKAWQAGYFPDMMDRPTIADLQEAISNELRGNPVYARTPGTTEEMRQAADELRAMLDQAGIDPDKASPKQIKDAVAAYQAEWQGGRAFDQGSPAAVQAVMDSLRRDAEAISNILQEPSFRTQGFNGVDVDAQTTMVRHVVSMAVQDVQVLDAIVAAIPVDVVDLLAREKLSAEGLLGNEAMLKDVLSADARSPIALSVDEANALAVSIATAATKALTPAKAGGAANSGATLGAGENVHSRNITETEAFSSWFGDSKVVDAEGKPLVVYHGGPSGIEAFNPEKIGSNWGYDRRGFYFTADKSEILGGAGDYANSAQRDLGSGEVYAVYAKLERPYTLEQYAADVGTTVEAVSTYGGDLLPAISIYDEDRDLIMDKVEEGGYDGIWFNTGVQPDGFRDDLVVAFDPTQIKSVNNRGTFDPNDARILYQSFNDGPNARIVFDQNRAIIELFQSANMSSFLHESGHLWLEELRADAETDGVPQQLKDDWQAVQDWFAANGHPLVDGVIPVEAHELWARGVERYLMEGRAPSSALQKAFDAFKSWMLNIYQVVSNLRSNITPEIRGVMDRLIATDEEIQQARETQNIKALFTDAAQAGMTEAEFKAYQESVSAARTEAFDALLYKTMATVRRQRTKAWKEEQANVIREVTDKVDRMPVFRALESLKGLKLDRAWLVETYGEDALSLIPKRVPPVYAEKNTTSADSIAELNGFQTGDEMVRALMGVEQRTRELRAADDKRSARQAMIDGEVDAIMTERHGDIIADGSIEQEALALIHNDTQGEVIASELRQLGKAAGRAPTPYRIAREWARNKIATSAVVESTSGRAIQSYQRAAAKAAKAAEAAMLKHDADETFRQKQSQMLNNALVSEARIAKEAIDAAVTRLGKVAKRATIKSVDQDYLDQAHALLEQVDFRTVSQRQLDRAESFEQWAQARTAEGHDIAVPDSFSAILGKTNWSRLTVENLLGLDDAVKQIIHLGRYKQRLIDAKEEREYEAVVGEALGQIGKMPPKPPKGIADPSWGDRIRSGVAHFDAALLKVETLVDWLDGGDANGVFNRMVFRPIADAQDRANDMRGDYLTRIATVINEMPDNTISRWQEKVDTGLIDRFTGKPWVATRQKLVALALNMGNTGNTQRVVDGYRWSEQGLRDILNRELTAEDWQFVQKTWDIIDTLWPEIEAMEKRINGLAPDKVEPVAFETPHGTMRGGYYPAVYDSRLSVEAEVNAGKATDLLETHYTKANTRASATKDRAEAVKNRPILLDLGVINRHLSEVIHDITHREAIMQADKFLSDKRIMEGVDSALGREYRTQFRDWLKFVANQWAMDRAGNEGITKWLSKARTNTTVVGMGFRISTILTQIAGYSNSFEAVGAKWVTPAIAQTAKNPIETFNFVMEKSGEVRHRMDTLDRDVRAGMDQLAGKNGFITEAQRFAFHGIGLADRMVVIPTWIGAYNKAIAAGETDENAVYAADKAVRQSQGSGSAKDLASVQRGTGKGGELLKYMTMFYSYMSAMYQRQRTLGRDVGTAEVRDVPALMSRALWLVIVPPVLSQILAGRGPDDDEDWGTWSFKQMLFNALGPIPIVRDAAQPFWEGVIGKRGFDYQISPVQRAVQTVVNSGKDIGKIVRGDDTKRATRNALESVGYATGLVPGQIATAVQFLVDVGYGEQDPETVSDWYEGLTSGKVKD